MQQQFDKEIIAHQSVFLTLGTPKRWLFWGNPVLIILMLCFIAYFGNYKVSDSIKRNGQIIRIQYVNNSKIVLLSCQLADPPKALIKGDKVIIRFFQTESVLEGNFKSINQDQKTILVEVILESDDQVENENKLLGQTVELKSNGLPIALWKLFINKIKKK